MPVSTKKNKKMTYYKWWTGNNQEAMKAHLKVLFWHLHMPWRTFKHYLATQQPTCSKSSYFWSCPPLPYSTPQAFHVEVTLLLAVVPSWWAQNSVSDLLSKLSLRMVAPWLGAGIPFPTLWGSGDLCELSVEKWTNWFTYLGVTVTCPWHQTRFSLFCGGSLGTFDMLL
jgi:hypothetical protein